jgi:trigger factor
MNIKTQREGVNIVLLDLEVDTTKAMKAYEATCRHLSQQVNIPGFRKGKAPRAILEQKLGTEYIKQETLEHLVPELLEEAISTEKLEPISKPQLNSYEFEPGKPLKLQAKFEVRPDVELGPYKGVKVNIAKVKVSEDAVEHALEHIAESRASLSEVASRPVAMGDTAVVDFECFVDEQLVDGGKASGMILEMKDDSFLEGFCEQLVGAKPGEKREVKVKFPDNYRNTALSGKDAAFQVEVKGLREKLVPQLDDELAKAVGSDSLEKLTESVKEHLEKEIEKENKAATQRAVIDAVVAQSKVEVPESMVEREHEALMGQLRSLVENDGGNWNEYKKIEQFASLNEAKHTEAKQRVLTSLVLGAIVRAENLTIADEELAPYFAEVAAYYRLPVERIAESPQARQKLIEEALIDKVVEYLVEKAEVKYDNEPVAVGS